MITISGYDHLLVLNGLDELQKMPQNKQSGIAFRNFRDEVEMIIYRPPSSITMAAAVKSTAADMNPRRDLFLRLREPGEPDRLTHVLDRFFAFYLYQKTSRPTLLKLDDETFVVKSLYAKGLSTQALIDLISPILLKDLSTDSKDPIGSG